MESWLTLHASFSFPPVPSSQNQNNVGLNTGTISLLSNSTVTFDCWGRNDGENGEGEKNDGGDANHGEVSTVWPSYQSMTRQPCFISQRHFVYLSKMRKYFNFNQKIFWERKIDQYKIQVIFANLTETEGLIIFYAQCDSLQRGKITRDEGI